MLNWKTYDPTWLVELATNCHPEQTWLEEALSKCTRAAQVSDAYIYFVDPSDPNEPGSEWQFEQNIVLEHPTDGDLVLDILKGHRVGGVEFLQRLPG